MAGIITVDTIQVDSIKTKAGETQSASSLGLSDSASGKNILINGAMQVAQRGTSVTGIGSTNVFGAIDRVKIFTGVHSGQITAEQVAITDLPGFANAMKLSCTTADTSISASENLGFRHMVEGQYLQQIKKGTASAEKTVLSFYVKANAAATYSVEIRDMDNDRINTQTFNVTTGWTRVEMVVDKDTTGPYDDDNASSLQISWWLHAGSTYTSGTFAENTWAARVQANRVKSTNTSFLDSTARTLFVTGIQYEVGEVASEFEHKKYSDTLLDCYRYFYKITRTDAYGEFLIIRTYSSTQGTGVMTLPVSMRAQPTFTSSSVSGNFSYGMSVLGFPGTDHSHRLATHNAVGAFTANGAAVVQKVNNTDAIFMQYDAEL